MASKVSCRKGGLSKPRGGRRGAGGEEEQAVTLAGVTTTHALLAEKVQRKVRNGVARLAAAGSSLDRQKSFHLGDAPR
jgi:hypothetical protein